jgi:raffinose/stachyose/melibiose transport system substrate-binding protein
MKKQLWMGLSVMLLAALLLGACGTPATEAPAPVEPQPAATEAPAAPPSGEGGEVYFLNFKPEVAEIYAAIGEAYKAETGVTLKVVTAAAGTYEQTLKSEIAKADAPVLFQINGPIGYASWKDYTADLSGTELYAHLSDKSIAVTDGAGVYGIPYVVEGYGIIYNNAIMDKYFALPGAKATSMAEVNNFATLKAVVEDMTAKKAELHRGRLLLDLPQARRGLALADPPGQCPGLLRVARQRRRPGERRHPGDQVPVRRQLPEHLRSVPQQLRDPADAAGQQERG